MYDEYDFTLEDAMDAVDEYIGDRAKKSAEKLRSARERANKKRADRKFEERLHKLEEVLEKRKLEKKAAIKKNIATGGKIGGAGLGAAGAGASAVKINNLRKELKALKLKAKTKEGLTEDEEKRIKDLKKQIAGYGAVGAASAGLGIASGVSAYKDFKGKPVKESVDEYRLNVYEAYESGLIDEDEKDIMLEMFDLENYE